MYWIELSCIKHAHKREEQKRKLRKEENAHQYHHPCVCVLHNKPGAYGLTGLGLALMATGQLVLRSAMVAVWHACLPQATLYQ